MKKLGRLYKTQLSFRKEQYGRNLNLKNKHKMPFLSINSIFIAK
jgi:hypothetical protein